MALNYIEKIAAAIKDNLAPDRRPEEHAEELYRLYAVLALVRGEQTTLEDVHDAWSAWMSGQEPNHESLRPFDRLDPQTREEDKPYVDAIHRAVRSL